MPVSDTALKSLYGPVGLDIGAETSEEIALSIISEIKAVLAGRPGGLLREKSGAIHTQVPEEKIEIVVEGEREMPIACSIRMD